MRAIRVVAVNVFRESVRDRVPYNLVVFAVLLIASSYLIGQLTAGQDVKIIKDLGLAATSIFGLFISIFIGIGLVSKEVERRSIYALLSKPVSRSQFIAGKYAGLVLTLAVNVSVMNRQRRRARSSEAGYTILELLISTAIMVTVTGAIFSLMNPAEGNAQAQPEVADMQQRMRVTSDTLSKELMMAGAGPYQGPITGSLVNYFAPILPRRVGSMSPDPTTGPGSFKSDVVTLAYIPNSYSQTTISQAMPPKSAEIKTNGQANCPDQAKDPLCGFSEGKHVIIFDTFGNWDMIHAIDARTGYEVWAFIPYNLLPKLKTFRDGQGVDLFDYFVDSSPKLAEVKLGGVWRSLLLIGEGPGGTFYQTFDVSEAGMGLDPEQDGLSAVNSMLSLFDTPNESIVFKWAFPNYSSFDPTYAATFTVSDATAGGKQRIYGDLKSSATLVEKTVGFTWSDPAIGPLTADRSVTAVVLGSGYFPDIEASTPNRGASAPKAGNAMYLLDANTGLPLGNSSGTTCTSIASGFGSGAGCVMIGDLAANGRKNALQADPTAAGESGSIAVSKAYLGDIDGRYWRFSFNPAGTITANLMVDTGQPIFASSALLFVGTVDVYMRSDVRLIAWQEVR